MREEVHDEVAQCRLSGLPVDGPTGEGFDVGRARRGRDLGDVVAVAQRRHGVEGLAEDVVVGRGQGFDGRWKRASGAGEGLGGDAGGQSGELELLVALAGLLLQQVLQFGVLGDVAEGQGGVVDQEEVLGGEAVVDGTGSGCADHLDRDAALDGYLVGAQVARRRGEADDDRVDGGFGEQPLGEVGRQVRLDA
ncbi:hypothetical protein [Streptomyces sp. NPDC046942]|uniref:hypothetical protein n=1 Tax=Streptomyces sp. NPDC046942 TaxID=3155137 RepID=UPI0033E40645